MVTLGLHRPRVGNQTPAEIRSFLEWVEALGYDSVWLGESWGQEAFSQLGWIAGFTQRIRLGVGIVNVFSRSAALIGQAAATVDQLSSGRLILGLGTSGQAVVENWHGVAYDRPVQRQREYLAVIRLVTRGERLNYDGELLHLKGLKLLFPPVRTHIPVYIAALGPISLRQTGELADGWNPIFLDPIALPRFQAELARGAARAGRDTSAIAIAPQIIVLVSDDARAALAYARAHIAHYICRMGVHYARHISEQGFAEDVERVQQAYAAREDFADAVSDRMAQALSITGSAAHCRERLEQYAAMGVNEPMLSFAADVPFALVQQTLEALAPARA